MSYSMFTNYSKEDIKELENEINNFCKDRNIVLQPKMDMVKECKKLGFTVYSLSLPDKIDGVILIEEGKKIIGVSNKLRDKKVVSRVVAHELSHYIRETKKQKDSEMLFAMKDNIFHNYKKEPLENEMDYMSAALLVPMNSFLNFTESLGLKDVDTIEKAQKIDSEKIELLADYYGVEEQLIVRRIVEASKYVG